MTGLGNKLMMAITSILELMHYPAVEVGFAGDLGGSGWGDGYFHHMVAVLPSSSSEYALKLLGVNFISRAKVRIDPLPKIIIMLLLVGSSR